MTTPLDRADPADQAVPFLDVHPPHWAARGLSVLLLALFVVAALVATLVQVPETVSAPFVLVAVRGSDPIRAPADATVVEVAAVEGAAVARDQPLFVVRARAIADRSSELGALDRESAGGAQRLASVRERSEGQRLADLEGEHRLEEKLAAGERMLEVKRRELALVRDLARRYEGLHADGLGSRIELEERQINASRMELELQGLEQEMAESRSALRRLRHQMRVNQADGSLLEQGIAEKLDAGSVRSSTLRGELGAVEGGALALRSPCAGTVIRLHARSPGAVVLAGDAMAEVACSGETLEAELALDQTVAARVVPGQEVKLLYDAYPYARYGVRFGKVRWVSPSATRVDGRVEFTARAAIDAQGVTVDGTIRPLLPGMAGSARVIADRRTLIGYVFEPVRELRERLRSSAR